MSEQESKGLSRRRWLAASAGAAGMAALAATRTLAQSSGRGPLKGKRVLVALGEFSEGMEAYYMIYRLMEEGVEPVVAAAEVKRLQMVVHDFEPQYSNYTEKLGYQIEIDVAYKDVDPSGFAGLLIPGGRGPEEIRQREDALKVVRYFLDRKLPLGAMCHGPQVVYAAGPVTGRLIAAYPGIRTDVELAGATFVDKPVVVDGALVTSRGWPDLPYFMPKFLEVLGGGRGIVEGFDVPPPLGRR
jgi:protease I